MSALKGLQQAIGYFFKDESFLVTAVTHPTYANEHRTESYQRLEYLGDAILDFVVAEDLFFRFSNADEGVLTKKRIAAVSATPLEKKARELGFEKYLKIAPHVNIDNVLGDVFEAVIAAIYLDGGIEPAKKFILRFLEEFLDVKASVRDYKSRLNEALPQAKISYREISRSGPPHDPVFEIELEIDGQSVATASAGSKKKAEQKCAAIALKAIEKDKNRR